MISVNPGSQCCKNWMGVVESRKYWHWAVDLNRAIAEMATFMKPKLTVLDATRALVTGGPGGPGDVARLDTIVAGTDPVAVDAYGLLLAPFGGEGYKIEDVPYIKMAAELNVGSFELDKKIILKKTIE